MSAEAHAPIAVLGASGQVGGAVAAQLAEAGHPVRTIGRRPLALPGVEHHALSAWTGDALGPALAGCRAAFLMVPLVPDAVALGRCLNAAADAAGIDTVVRLSVLQGLVRDGVGLGRLHAAIDDDLRARSIPRVLTLCPDSFMQNLLGAAPQVAAGELQDATGDGRMAFVDVHDIAACAVSGLLGHAAPGVHDLTGPAALSMDEVADTFTRVLGRPVAYTDLSVAERRRQYRQWGLSDFLADTLAELAAWTRSQPPCPVTDAVRAITGHPPTALGTFIERHGAAWGQTS